MYVYNVYIYKGRRQFIPARKPRGNKHGTSRIRDDLGNKIARKHNTHMLTTIKNNTFIFIHFVFENDGKSQKIVEHT